MITYKEFLEGIKSGDIAPNNTKINKKVQKKPVKISKKEIKESVDKPEDFLRKAGIKIKSTEMDDESYVILLFKKEDVEKASKLLKGQKYEVHEVGKLLYIS